ncbi:hypothetical protein IWX47DRAFT_906145 [Phyllosticta citricarpa]
MFHSCEEYKYKIVILRCLACEATNSVCDGQIPCSVCFRNGVECFPYSELVDDNLVWSRWTAMSHERIDTSNHGQLAEESSREDLQPSSLEYQYPEEVYPSVSCQFLPSTDDHPDFPYQQQFDMSDPIEPYFQSTPSTSSPAHCLNNGTSSSPDYPRLAHTVSETTNFQQSDAEDLQTTSTIPRKRQRTGQSDKGKEPERNKRTRTDSSVMPQSMCLTPPFTPGPCDRTRSDLHMMEEPSEQTQHQFQMSTPDSFADLHQFLLDSEQAFFGFDNMDQDTTALFEDKTNSAGPSRQFNLSRPVESGFSPRSLSPVQQQPAANHKPEKTWSRRRSKPSTAAAASKSKTTNPTTLTAAGPGTRTGGGRYDGATYDAPHPSTSLPSRFCNLTAIEILTYLPKHAWSHPDICMRLVDEGWGDSTMADYITVTRGRRQLKNSIGKSITTIGKAKYPWFREVSAQELARVPHDYGTVPIAGLDYVRTSGGDGGKAAAAAAARRGPKFASQWRVKLHRKVNHLPQVSLATDGFAPGKTSLPMWKLADGVRPGWHPIGPDALDLTRCVEYAVKTRAVHEWLFPDDWEEVLRRVGGPAPVLADSFDRPALERWKALREGLSDMELCK